MDSICLPIYYISSPWVIFFLVEIIIILFFLSPLSFFKTPPDKRIKVLYLALSTPLFLFVSLISAFFILLFYGESYDDLIASKYFPLNAAIKNTCYLDPNRNNCPTNLSELINIEPDKFSKLTLGTALKYVYYPETNNYSLVVIEKKTYKGVIFDQRLTTLKDVYGYGSDFFDITASYCGGKYKINNPPPIDGPWSDI